MAYTQTTWGELKARLLSRLGEETWYTAELRQQALNEAMQVWQCLVGEWLSGPVNAPYAAGVFTPSTADAVEFPLRVMDDDVELDIVSLTDLVNSSTNSIVAYGLGTTASAASMAAPVGAALIVLDTVPGDTSAVSVWGLAPPPAFAADGTVLQLQEAEMDAIVEYAAHVCMFSEGGAEFQASTSALQKMVSLALRRNERLSALAPYRKYLGTDKAPLQKSLEIPTTSGGR